MSRMWEDDFEAEMNDMTARFVDDDEDMRVIREKFPTVPKYIIDHYGAKGFLWLPADVLTRIVNGLGDGITDTVSDDFPGE